MATAAKHRDKPRDYWRAPGPDMQFGRERFRVVWVPHTGSPLDISEHAEAVNWTDDPETMLTGDLRVRDPVAGAELGIGQGDEIVLSCALDESANYVELWRMRGNEPYRSYLDGSRVVQLETGLALLQRSLDDFNYTVKTSQGSGAHVPGAGTVGVGSGGGWLASEIAIDIANRYQVPIGEIAQTTHRIVRLTGLQVSPMEILGRAYTREKKATHRRFVISMDHGKLNIRPLRRSPVLLGLGPSLVAASLQETLRDDFATAVTVRAQATVSVGKDKKRHDRITPAKIMVKVQSDEAIRRFGYVHRDIWAHDAATWAGARAAGLRHLALVGKPLKQSNLTHPGIPMVKRGQALRVLLPDPLLDQVVFVVRAAHSLSGNDYSMDLQLGFTDPFVDAKIDLTSEDRTQTARERARLAQAGSKAAKIKKRKHSDDLLTPGRPRPGPRPPKR